tara:strand:+ start:112 stop:267 length:156 start_codon:yes stop_codon:yes gene_type:complete
MSQNKLKAKLTQHAGKLGFSLLEVQPENPLNETEFDAYIATLRATLLSSLV